MKRNSSFTEHLAKRRPSLLADHIIRGLEHGAASPVNAIPPPINTSSSKSPMSTRRASSPLSMPQSPHTPTTPLTPHTPTTPITPMEGEWTAVDEQGSGSSDENKIDTDDDDGAHTVNIGAESDDENESKFSNRAVNRKLENISPVQVRFPTREHARGNGAAGRYGGWVGWERDNVWWRVDGGRCHTGKSGGGPLWGVPAAVTGAAQTALIRTLTHSTYTRHSVHVLNSWIGVSALSYPSNSFPTPLFPPPPCFSHTARASHTRPGTRLLTPATPSSPTIIIPTTYHILHVQQGKNRMPARKLSKPMIGGSGSFVEKIQTKLSGGSSRISSVRFGSPNKKETGLNMDNYLESVSFDYQNSGYHRRKEQRWEERQKELGSEGATASSRVRHKREMLQTGTRILFTLFVGILVAAVTGGALWLIGELHM